MSMTSRQIRREFLEFFQQKGHTVVASAPVVPHDDPTLMFTNAGMNQFKDVFLGRGTRPYKRAADTQKCIRVSGKHNDLEEVGPSPYHHTFFEMLGNWSFGDYFKAEAIAWAWELLVQRWGLPDDRLWATVFEGDPQTGVSGDEESARLWTELTSIPPGRVLRFGKKDNFWQMGPTGPCGPCSELHIDLGEQRGARCRHRVPCGVNAEDEHGKCMRFIELWNLVFIQYNCDASGTLTPLPARHVDTGMGFERIAAVLQGKASNYDSDVFAPLMRAIGELSGKQYQGQIGRLPDTAFRVVADHVRTLTFAMADGCLPSNEGRGYVLRRLLRRAARYGRQQLEMGEPFIHRLVPVLVETMGHAFPELCEKPDYIAEVIRDEEQSFGRTLDRGIRLFSSAAKEASDAGRPISAEAAFRLYDESGFPIDLTTQMAREAGVDVDTVGFERLMQEKRQSDRQRAKGFAASGFSGALPPTDDSGKYATLEATGTVLGWVIGEQFADSGSLGQMEPEVGLVTDRTCFYAESGGQVGDVGTITTPTGRFAVDDTRKIGRTPVHIGHLTDGHIEVGQVAELAVDRRRVDTMRNHTATHLLHDALRRVLGPHAAQRGSLVEPGRLRFDFDHNKPVSPEQLAEVERIVNENIYADHQVFAREMPIEQGRALGAMALFGEKYGQTVRVVSIGAPDADHLEEGFSNEFCGGTHLSRTGRVGPFKIVSEEAVAKGVRRITAVTGPAAVGHIQATDRRLAELAELLRAGPDQLGDRVRSLQEEIKGLRKQLEKGAGTDMRAVLAQLLEAAEPFGESGKLIVGEVPDVPVEQVRGGIDWLRKKSKSAAILLAGRGDRKVSIIAGVTEDLVAAGLKAGDWVRHTAAMVDGKGGGRAGMAQGGGKSPEKLPAALEAAKAFARKALGG